MDDTEKKSKLPTFYLLNPTSLAKTNAKEQLLTDIATVRADLALIVETWFTSKHLDIDLSLDGYALFRRDRVGRKCGGLCAYVCNNNEISCSVIFPDIDCACSEVEIMWLKLEYFTEVFFIALCYYPPNPIHTVDMFVRQLSAGIEYFTVEQAVNNFKIIVAGDFNTLCTDFLVNNYGLYELVDLPTHGSKVLDKFFISLPDLYRPASVCRSLIKTKHMGILVQPLTVSVCRPKSHRHKVRLYDKRAHNIDRLRNALGTFNWSDVTMLMICIISFSM